MTVSDDQNLIGLTMGTVDNKENKVVETILVYKRDQTDSKVSFNKEVERPFDIEDACPNFKFNHNDNEFRALQSRN